MTGRDGIPLERRRLLAGLGAGTIAGLAGCVGGDDDEDDELEDRTFEPNVEHPGDEPIEFTDDQHCVVCNMTPSDYPNRKSQLAHENGEGAVACSPGCFAAYYAATASDSEIVGAWTTEIDSGNLIDATDGYFVLVTEEDPADAHMGGDPRPFARYGDAVDFLEEWDAEELSEEDDVVELEGIDRDVAMIYRASRL